MKARLIAVTTLLLVQSNWAISCESNFADTEKIWKQRLKQTESIPNKNDQLADTLYGMSRFYSRWGAYDKALPLLKRYVEIRQNNPEKTFFYKGWLLVELGDLYYKQKQWSDAITKYSEALAIFEDTRRWLEIPPTLNKLANCYTHSNNFAMALSAYRRALEVNGTIKHKPGLEKYKGLADAYNSQLLNDYSEAQNKTVQSKGGLSESNLERLALYYCHSGKYFEADRIYDMLLERQTTTQQRANILSKICKLQKQCQAEIQPFAGTNAYLKEFSRLKTREDVFSRRSALVSKYAYAVPSDKALSVFSKYQPILEIGAGTGYWAYLLKQRGIEVKAFEPFLVPKGNAWFPKSKKNWTTVLPGDQTVVSNYPQYTLFMCYPPGRTEVAFSALNLFKGKHMIYIGEASGVAPGEGQDKFHNLIKKEWQLIEQIEMPQWPGLYDALFVYKRK